jgi:gamma-glutamylcyclotransferase (GGCT)/AIG2-like uncharacterized protein YtfP
MWAATHGMFPYLFDAPGQGLKVQCEVFRVASAEVMGTLDILEGVPHHYKRKSIKVRRVFPSCPAPPLPLKPDEIIDVVAYVSNQAYDPVRHTPCMAYWGTFPERTHARGS